ncbi:hypothetical protein HYV69_04160 [Candidatus Uhrbacteria bacterium]|nr:hypothetical protein [Candidatus Uhrbacteria bacterium]
MPKLSIKLFPLLAMMVLFLSPFAVQAETTCACFCATKNGAVQASDAKVTPDKCESLCEKSGSDFLSCAKTAREYPGNNALCFTAVDCEKVKGKLSATQPPECPTGMKNCFPGSQAVKAKLNVKIGTLETVEDLGTYVSAVYSWMLGAAAVIAVVFIMIGGLQWVLSAGGASSVATAKSRIKNGIVGLLLLISVSLILQTVNPELLKLQVPKPSLLRQIVLADSSCEKLVQEGYTIETEQSAKKECGTSAIIKKDPSGNAVADGLTCQYTKCAKGACVGGPGNEQCVECRYVSAGNPSSPGSASPSVCKMMETSVYEDQITNGIRYLKNATYCTFGKGGLAGVEGLQTSTDVSITHDACLEYKVDCHSINDCEGYDDIKVDYYNNGSLTTGELRDVNETVFGFLCISDPCGVKGKSSDIVGCSLDSASTGLNSAECDNIFK